LTAALAHLLTEQGMRLTLADTDVDAPNLHIVLGAEFDRSTAVAASDKAIIDYDKCSRCMNCVDACAFNSIIGGEKPVVISYSCEGCGVCALVCREEAVSVQPVENGRINFVTSGAVRVVAGELGIGESSSGRLVDIVKRQARQEASLTRSDLLLTDGPPGIGCPVIAALKGADYAVLVTEPTPSALSDLQRIVEVVRGFKIPAGAVLNRSDMDPQSAQTTKNWLTRNELPLLGEIPYDPCLPRALARGDLGVKMYPDAPSSLAIKKLYKAVEGLLD
ncbi:MAG: 4Fe-4S dicluster domain-containing protein, partial [Candidatus Electrothrix sp. AUS1_2]|nr:4Fe-4S dicluster domain-containing protein [Candidatus Electrothrix sp. AUS1_2]